MLGGPVASVGLPFELARGVGVGVDREVAVVGDGQVEQFAGRVEPFRPAVDLDRGLELLARGEDDVGVERARRAPADHPSGAVAEDVDVRRGDGEQHPLRHLPLLHAQLGVHAGDDDVETRQQVLAEVEGPVFEDVDLHPGQDPERSDAAR